MHVGCLDLMPHESKMGSSTPNIPMRNADVSKHRESEDLKKRFQENGGGHVCDHVGLGFGTILVPIGNRKAPS